MDKLTSEGLVEKNIGRYVELKLKGGETLAGKLKWFDQHMNLVLEIPAGTWITSFVLVRGDNVVYIGGVDFRGV